jgi:hypothetical protein
VLFREGIDETATTTLGSGQGRSATLTDDMVASISSTLTLFKLSYHDAMAERNPKTRILNQSALRRRQTIGNHGTQPRRVRLVKETAVFLPCNRDAHRLVMSKLFFFREGSMRIIHWC